MSRSDPPELHFKIWPLTITAKGREAIQAVRRPLAVIVVAIVPLFIGLACYGGFHSGMWSFGLSWLKRLLP